MNVTTEITVAEGIQVVEEKSVVATFRVNGLPTVTHPSIGDDMSDGVTINESNQKEYSAPYYREYDECSIVEGDKMEFISAITNPNGDMEVTVAKDFTNKSDVEIERYMSKISTLALLDNISGQLYHLNVVELGGCIIGE